MKSTLIFIAYCCPISFLMEKIQYYCMFFFILSVKYYTKTEGLMDGWVCRNKQMFFTQADVFTVWDYCRWTFIM